MVFGLFKFIKDAIQEGVEEGKAELAAEQAIKEAQNQELIEKFAALTPKEIFLVSLGAPLRELFVEDLDNAKEGNRPAYYLCSTTVPEEKKEELKKYLKRDFDITDEESFLDAFQLAREGINPADKLASSVWLARLSYLTTMSAGLKYIPADNALQMLEEAVQPALPLFTDWQDYAESYLAGEKNDGTNNALGRKILERQVKKLLESPQSPWKIQQWLKD